jgi:alpha-galactosidase
MGVYLMSKVYHVLHNNMAIGFLKDDKNFSQSTFDTECVDFRCFSEIAKPMFQLAIAGEQFGFNPGLVTGQTNLPKEMKIKSIKEEQNNKIITYINERLELEVAVNIQFVPDVDIIRCFTSVKNIGHKQRVITHLSSIFMTGIACGGFLNWDDKSKIKVNFCMQTWEGEGQWRTYSLEDAGVYRNSVHPNAAVFHLSSTGTWSTGRFTPCLILEDMECNKVWYIQIETSANWHIELGFDGLIDKEGGALYLQADGADEKFGGFYKLLNPGEEFISVPSAIGTTNGGFDEAIKQLTKYRRGVLKPKIVNKSAIPIMYNDYMNCLWANLTMEREIPLIDAAYKAGAEGYCLDAGWYLTSECKNWAFLGDWEPSDNRFGEKGLQFVIDYIRSKGMIAGLWLEIEMCSEGTELSKKPDDWFIRRYGMRVGSGDRMPLNFANPDVRDHMYKVVDRLVSMGVGFFKNDYNLCVGNGDDTNGSAADGLLDHIRGFYIFIDEIRQRHPGLVLENCASGAMREDYGILSHFDIQSVSDQEIYTLMPSVISGSLANVLPEQLGIWSYPYPHLFFDRDNQNIIESEDYISQMKNGEQTVFNMVNGLLGITYLSGRIDKADDYNFTLIKEALELAKAERKFIANSYPLWPNGFSKIADIKSFACVGLQNEEESRVLLAVWRMSSDKECYSINLGKFKNKSIRIKQLYPSNNKFLTKTYFDENTEMLEVYLKEQNTARFFEIIIE